MKIIKQSSKLLKPIYNGDPPPSPSFIPLSVFDRLTYDAHMPLIYAFKPPTPSNSSLQLSFQILLSHYRPMAGRFDTDDNGHRIIRLNDEGARLTEAWTDCPLDQAIPFHTSQLPILNSALQDGTIKELCQVQLTRFTCGSLVIGLSSNHTVADASSASQFLVSWSQIARGLTITPRPLHDRSIFPPCDPPQFEYEHRGVEFVKTETTSSHNSICESVLEEGVVVHKVHYSKEFLANLKSKISKYSTFEAIVAHIWRTTVRARKFNESETASVKISVGGRRRLRPPVPDEYFGNVVLWAYPRAKVKDLVNRPLSYAAQVIHEALVKLDDGYFKSFIDFASYKVDEENLMSTTMLDGGVTVRLEVDSWMRFPFREIDFGYGNPCLFMPSYIPLVGQLYLVPDINGDGSLEAHVTLLEKHMDSFKEICYCLE